MARNVYMTAGKKRLIDFMTDNKDRHFSVDEIAEELPGVGKSSVYRMVSKLHQEGVLRRFETDGMSSFVYQYVEQDEACEHHFHLKCADCGRIIHMECDELEKVKNHIEAEHGFSIGVKNSMIYGICQDCRSGERSHHRKGCKCSACKCIVSVIMVMVLLFSLLLSGCTGGVSSENDGKLKIVTTIFPQYDFVREIMGEEIINDPDSNAEVSMLIKPGAESHTFMPSTEDMLKIEQCDILICVGGETDAWVDEEILPSVDMSKKKVLYLTDMVELLCAESEHDHEEHEHGHDSDVDDHVWTSPENAKIIVNEIATVMSDVDKDNAETYKVNAEAYCSELEALSDDFEEMIGNAPRKKIVIGDRFPFLYFAKEYGLDYIAAFKGCSSSSEPTLSVVNDLVTEVKNSNLPVVFAIEFSNGKTADGICNATGAKRLLLHSCHNVTTKEFEEGEGYLSLMRQNLENLREALYE